MKKDGLKIWLPFFLVCMLMSFGTSVFAQPAGIETMAKKYLEEKGNHGLFVGIVIGEEQWTLPLGTTDRKNGTAVTDSTRFEIGSITKTFTTLLMSKMAQDGNFFPDAPIDLYLPANFDPPAFQAEICYAPDQTIGAEDNRKSHEFAPVCVPHPDSPRVYISMCNLAMHNSGLPAMPKGFFTKNPFKFFKQIRDPYRKKDLDGLFEYLEKTEIKRAPGTEMVYSNFGMSILGQLLARAKKRPYPELLQEMVLQPLEMKETYLALAPKPDRLLAPGHKENGKSAHNWHFDAWAPAGALRATGRDMMRYLLANLGQHPTELTPAMNECHAPRFAFNHPKMGENEIGWGWFISPLPNLPQKVTWHNGGTAGYKSYIGFNKELQVGVVLLSNSANEVTNLGRGMMEVLVREAKASQ